jgi:hypothetical protein
MGDFSKIEIDESAKLNTIIIFKSLRSLKVFVAWNGLHSFDYQKYRHPRCERNGQKESQSSD